MKAIVFTSNTGTTEKYARLLADKTGLPAYSSEQARRELADGSEIIYLGWLKAGEIAGYAKAANIRFWFPCRQPQYFPSRK